VLRSIELWELVADACGMLWDVVGCCGMLWDVVGCCGDAVTGEIPGRRDRVSKLRREVKNGSYSALARLDPRFA
jgi:hypothetical protein